MSPHRGQPTGPGVPPPTQATLLHAPGRSGRSPKGPLVGEMPRTMQSNRKLICSPSAEDRKKTPAPAGWGQTLLAAGPSGRQEGRRGSLEQTRKTATRGGRAPAGPRPTAPRPSNPHGASGRPRGTSLPLCVRSPLFLPASTGQQGELGCFGRMWPREEAREDAPGRRRGRRQGRLGQGPHPRTQPGDLRLGRCPRPALPTQGCSEGEEDARAGPAPQSRRPPPLWPVTRPPTAQAPFPAVFWGRKPGHGVRAGAEVLPTGPLPAEGRPRESAQPTA